MSTPKSNRFRIQLMEEFSNEVEGGVIKLKSDIATHLIESISEKMPTDTTRARANTIVSNRARDTSFDEEARDKSGQEAIRKGKAVIARNVKPFSKIFVQNNAPYIEKLEGGHSNQAPLGMFGLAVAEVGVFFG